ncbi:MAG: inosine/xanthosine triphosphatase [Methanomassiliicoccaceae archaeon]|jgi:inosine/xanthosine triphosphatase|nr:inosine/xanthosine triphosphatase [Methanomassiliicoccaceae archaeon]
MKAILGGTFNLIHDGHKALIDRAFELSDQVVIGLTTDKFASATRKRINPYYLRMKALLLYLDSIRKCADILPISDEFGSVLTADKGYLVVSRETEKNALAINKKRIAAGREPMVISVIDMVKNSSGVELHASKMLSGEYSRTGEKNVTAIAVGSLNPVKVEAVRTVMEKVLGSVRVIPVKVSTGVPDQPFGEDTYKGAVNRANAALGKYALSVGIEAGVFEMYGHLYDIQHCAIIDKDGKITIGMSSGFRYPDKVAELIRGGMTVSKAMIAAYENASRGDKEGAVGLLSKGLLDRKALTEQSVTAAMIPRIWDEP